MTPGGPTASRSLLGFAALIAIAAGLVGCTTTTAARRGDRGAVERGDVPREEVERGEVERGKASWYGGRFQGRKTASGERFDKRALTAAHKHLRFGTRVRVTNLANGRHVVVRINDRGPYARGRIIDMSEAAAREVGMIESGIVPVELRILSVPPPRR